MRNLQTAWEAIERGDRVEAQSLVAQILRDDPRNAEAWMVLGEAVSGDRQKLFLRKALQLNPDLEPARERLAELESIVVEAESEPVEPKPDLPPVPPNVSLDAPTVPIAERVDANRSAPLKTNADKVGASRSKKKKSNLGNTLLLIIVAIGIMVTLFYLINSLPG